MCDFAFITISQVVVGVIPDDPFLDRTFRQLEIIEKKIFLIRTQKVMIDRDIAELYGVETRRLNEQIKRNIKRFPEDFMFQLTREEFNNLKSQIATSSWGGIRKLPYAFTENGVAMLSSVLSSDRAIEVNIQIMRTFIRLKSLALDNTDLKALIGKIERRLDAHATHIVDNKENIRKIIKTLNKLLTTNGKRSRKIGFK